MLKRFMKNKKGFTLVELMVVVVILGILVAIAVPVYNSITGTAEANACMANQRTIESAITQWYADGTNTGDPAMSDLVGKYLVDEPMCGNNSYVIPAKGQPVECPSSILEHAR